ncbi:hypothetical protein KJZ61_01095 [Candidatus Dependentiae bacterium]|nr:hypothetical protein [Candidatus Dependentiae bacterium]
MNRNFSIQVTKERFEGDNFDTFKFNLIVNGKVIRKFPLSFEGWSLGDYKQQWIEALKRLQTHKTTCLVTFYNNHIIKRGFPGVDTIDIFKVINSKLLFQPRNFSSDEYIKMLKEKEYNMQSCYDFIMPFETHDDNGWELQYWSCDYDPQEIDQLIAELKE